MLLEMNMAGGVQKDIDNLAEGIARRLWTEKGQYQIWSFAHPPDSESLAKILAMFGNMELAGGRIEQSAQPQRRVDREARQCLSRAFGLALQDVIHENGGKRDILQEIVDRAPATLGNEEKVGADGRNDEVLVDFGVQFKRVAVGRLPGIVVRDHLGRGTGAAGKPGSQ